MNNKSLVSLAQLKCVELQGHSPIPLEAYAACLSSKSQFYYTITFLLIPMVFYLTEFLTLQREYEPTGLRQRIQGVWKDLRDDRRTWAECIVKGS